MPFYIISAAEKFQVWPNGPIVTHSVEFRRIDWSLQRMPKGYIDIYTGALFFWYIGTCCIVIHLYCLLSIVLSVYLSSVFVLFAPIGCWAMTSWSSTKLRPWRQNIKREIRIMRTVKTLRYAHKYRLNYDMLQARIRGGGTRGPGPPLDPRFWDPKIEHFWALFNFSIIFFRLALLSILFL